MSEQPSEMELLVMDAHTSVMRLFDQRSNPELFEHKKEIFEMFDAIKDLEWVVLKKKAA